MSRSTKATLVFLVGFIGVVVYLSTRIAQVECDLCVTFDGQTACRTAAAGTRAASIESAVTSACGTLAGGMTETIRCQNTPPDKVACRGE
jgi:hypothetical protein